MPDDRRTPGTPGDRDPRQPDETAINPPRGEPDPDETARWSAADETARFRPSDETARFAGGEFPAGERPTAAYPPGSRPGQDAEPAPSWSGRAEVPAQVREPMPGDWDGPYEAPGRPWWTPILIGVIALVVLAAGGIWLGYLLTSSDGEAPQPSPSPTALPSATAAPTSAAATSAPATSAAPTSPATTAPASVPMPDLVGLPEAEARAELDALGLGYRLRFRTSDEPAGTVIATEPGAGNEVASGDTVTLVIAQSGGDETEPPEEPTGAPTPTS